MVVEVEVLTKVMVSPLARTTASRVMEATTRALTAALAPTTREDMAAMVHPSQVEADSVMFKKPQIFRHQLLCSLINLHVWYSPFSQEDIVPHHLTRVVGVVIIIPISPIALEATAAATSHLT